MNSPGAENIMKVHVKAFGYLRRFLGDNGERILELKEGCSLSQLLKSLLIPEDLPIVNLVNGRPGQKQQTLRDGDEIVLFSPMEGG